jgi:hypothetical protein
VALVLNKRYIVKRGKGVDVDSLLRNVPGGVTLVDDPEVDVREMEWNDVTASSFQEQDRLNVDFDELTGNFSQGSVQTNRKLNETVGGMQMMGGAANQMTEYTLRTFVETWAEKALGQLLLLIKEYETDGSVLELAAGKAGIQEKYGIPPSFDLLSQPMTLRVNVGLGATDPHKKMERLVFALQTYSGALQSMPDADPEGLRKEIFGLAGYKDASRLFKQQENPANVQMQQQMQEMGQLIQELQQKTAKQELQLAARDGELQIKGAALQIDAYDAETKRIAATKPEAAEPDTSGVEMHKLSLDAQNAQQDRIKDLQVTAMQKSADTEKQLMQLAAKVIEAQLNQKAPAKEMETVDPKKLAETLSTMMGAIEGLGKAILAPRVIERDPATGRAISSRVRVDA